MMQSYADYLMILSPPQAVVKEIDRYKRASVRLIGHFDGMHSRAHITITNQVRCKPFLAQHSIERMEIRLNTIAPLELHINGFGFFEHGKTAKTIYAKIEATDKTMNWFRLLRNEMHIKVKNFVPHITIARNIPVPAFNKLWPNFENRPFSAIFKAESLTILQRDTYGETNHYALHKEIFFANRIIHPF